MIFKLEKGTNPFRFIGVSYSKCMSPLRSDGRPMITMHLFLFVLWLKLPFKHVSGTGHGCAVESYGFVLRLAPIYFCVNLGFKSKRIL